MLKRLVKSLAEWNVRSRAYLKPSVAWAGQLDVTPFTTIAGNCGAVAAESRSAEYTLASSSAAL